jgi:peptidoglycan hydrolase-like protein with peptidoglycan-binding domain
MSSARWGIDRLDRSKGGMMSNAAQPIVGPGDAGENVCHAQRALRRTPNFTLVCDGEYGAKTEAAVREFQKSAGLPVDGVVGPSTWAVLPDGGPMPVLREGTKGEAVVSLQRLLTTGAPGQWKVTPQGIDGEFGKNTKASVIALQTWVGLPADGVVGQQTWDSINTSLETAVGLRHIVQDAV